MYVEEGADILFLDSPHDDEEIRRAVKAAAGRPSFAVLSPGAPRATPDRDQAIALGFKIGTYPTGMLSPATAGIKAGLAALAAGEAEAPRRTAAGRTARNARLWRLRRRGQEVHHRRLRRDAGLRCAAQSRAHCQAPRSLPGLAFPFETLGGPPSRSATPLRDNHLRHPRRDVVAR